MKRTFFRGRYYKHQSEEETICIIVGHASSGDFVQIITNDEVVRLPSLCGCNVSNKGIKLCYPNVKGELHYTNLKPLRTHIMGPFHYLPMQCSHEVVSMEHRVNGYIQINGRRYDFTEGKGYIEGDKGRSFPKEYLWLHSNAFEEDLSVMVSIAHIPFVGMSFTGCLCAIMYRGK